MNQSKRQAVATAPLSQRRNFVSATTGPDGTQHPTSSLIIALRSIADLTASQHRLLDELGNSVRPLSITQLAERTGLHPNSLRETLNALLEKNLISRTAERHEGRGRPSWRYEPSAPASLEFLANQVAEITTAVGIILDSETDQPLRLADLIGRQWAEQIFSAQHLPRHSAIDPDAPSSHIRLHIAKVRIFLSGMGFDAHSCGEPERLLLRTIPIWNEFGEPDEFRLALYGGVLDQILRVISHDRIGIKLTYDLDEHIGVLNFLYNPNPHPQSIMQ